MRFVPRRTADIRGILARPKSFLQRSLQAMSMTLACLAATAAANDVLYTGGATLNGTGDFSPANIFSAPGLNEFVTVNVNTIDLVGPAVDTVRVVGFQGNINFNLSAGRSISGAGVNGAYLTTTTGNITSVVDGNLPGLTNGIVMDARFAPLGGNVDLSGTGDINGVGGWGVWLLSDTGSVTMNGINSITAAAGHGIYVDSTGTVNLGTTTPLGTINAGLSGIEVIQVFDPVNNGPISVHTGDITAGGFGVHTLGWEQNTWVRMPGTLTSTGTTGIYSTSTLGNIIVDGLGTGVVIGADEGITLGSTAGNQTVQNFASVTGADTALWMLSGTGNQLVSNNGTLTGTLGDGILAGTLGGNISIQGSGTVGGISGGGRDGINANAL